MRARKKQEFSEKVERYSYVVFFFIFQFIMILSYFLLVENGQDAYIAKYVNDTQSSNLSDFEEDTYHTHNYLIYTDISVMIFIGFGLLMSFLKRYGHFSSTMAFLISCVTMELSILTVGYAETLSKLYQKEEVGYKISVDLMLLIKALFAGGAALVSMGAVIGKISPFQLLLMVFLEIPVYSLNLFFGEGVYRASDTGRSMFVHCFGAYFGIGASIVITPKEVFSKAHMKESATRGSDMFSFVATLFLWIYWPSFNSGGELFFFERTVVNSILSMLASSVACFCLSRLLRKKFNMLELQNATLAGGVGIGACSNFVINPGIVLLIGSIAGTVSILGYRYIQNFLRKYLKIHDTCGVLNLHGLPGTIAGFSSIFVSMFPNHYTVKHSNWQPLMQLFCLGTTIVIAFSYGLIVGHLLRLSKKCYEIQFDDLYDDTVYFDSKDIVTQKDILIDEDKLRNKKIMNLQKHFEEHFKYFNVKWESLNFRNVISDNINSNTKVVVSDYRGEMVAVKIFKFSITNEKTFAQFEKEVEILSSIKHENCLSLVGCTFSDLGNIGLVTPYCKNGNLAEYIFYKQKRNEIAFSFMERVNILRDICRGMIYIHENDIIHRDLKAENVFLDEELTSKIGDFGVSKFFVEGQTTQTGYIGTSFYMAPEICLGEKYTKSVDRFSFGILMYIILFLDLDPFKSDSPYLQFKIASDEHFRPKINQLQLFTCPGWLIEIMKNMWSHQPKNRMTFSNCFEILNKNENSIQLK